MEVDLTTKDVEETALANDHPNPSVNNGGNNTNNLELTDDSVDGKPLARNLDEAMRNTEQTDTASSIPSALRNLGPKGSCSWALNSPVCKHTILEVDYCRGKGCSNKVHNICQIEWECGPEGKEMGPGILRCPYHHMFFPKAVTGLRNGPTALAEGNTGKPTSSLTSALNKAP